MIPRCKPLKREVKIGAAALQFREGWANNADSQSLMMEMVHHCFDNTLISTVILHVIVKAVTKCWKHRVCFYRELSWTFKSPNGQKGGIMRGKKEVQGKNQVKYSSIKRNNDWFFNQQRTLRRRKNQPKSVLRKWFKRRRITQQQQMATNTMSHERQAELLYPDSNRILQKFSDCFSSQNDLGFFFLFVYLILRSYLSKQGLFIPWHLNFLKSL